MQRIEKYGVIALVFLLVTILAVSLWSQKKGKNPFNFFKSKTDAEKIATRDESPSPVFQADPGPVLNPDPPAESFGARPIDAGTSPFDPFPPARLTNSVDGGGNGGTAQVDQTLPEERQDSAPAGERKLGVSAPSAERRDKPAPATGRTYLVKSGETLGEIASRELGSFARWSEIAQLNGNLDPKKVRAGMKLALPADAKTPAVTQKSAAKVNGRGESMPGGSYVVRSGDTLSGIAAKVLGNEGRWPEIAVLNPGVDPKRLKVGSRLRVPGGADVREKPASQPQNLLAKAGNGKGRVR